MPGAICGKTDVTDEHKPFTEHYDGDITINVDKLMNNGDFQFIEVGLVIERANAHYTRTRYIKRFPAYMADETLLDQYFGG